MSDRQGTYLMQSMTGAYKNEDPLFRYKKKKKEGLKIGNATKISLLGLMFFTFFVYPYIYVFFRAFLNQIINSIR